MPTKFMSWWREFFSTQPRLWLDNFRDFLFPWFFCDLPLFKQELDMAKWHLEGNIFQNRERPISDRLLCGGEGQIWILELIFFLKLQSTISIVTAAVEVVDMEKKWGKEWYASGPNRCPSNRAQSRTLPINPIYIIKSKGDQLPTNPIF